MSAADHNAGALAGLRVVELVPGDAALGGKLLADLGAEVVSVRQQGPAGQGEACGHDSLQAEVAGKLQGLGKHLLPLDLENAGDRETMAGLLASADVFLEQTPPGHLARLGLDHTTLARANPGLVTVSISPFGITGPNADLPADDLTLWALGGMLYVTGGEDRPPLSISTPQASLVAGAHAALAAMIAHAHARRTGHGQRVDLAVQACIPWVAQTAPDYWPCFQDVQRRGGDGWTIPSQVEPGGLRRTTLWPCRDGHVCAYLIAGGPAEKMNAAMFQWMRDEGCPPPAMEGMAWDYFSLRTVRQETVDAIEAAMAGFFAKLDKMHLFQEGQRRGVMVYPVLELNEVLADPQLEDRGFWAELELAGGGKAKAPHQWVHMGRTPLAPARAARSVEDAPALAARWGEAGRTSSPALGGDQPFAGLLVADFSWAVAGPLTTRYLAEHGATVVRVESTNPRAMDIVRSVPPYWGDQPSLETSGLYHRLNVNKLSLTLDLGSQEGRDLARRLALRADVVVENFRHGVMARWGLDHAALCQENPGLIYLSSTNLGQTGPLASYGGFGNLLTAYAGFYALTGWPGEGPLPLPGAYTDYVAPILSGLALCAALRHREATGMGQHIDLSQMECGLAMLALPLAHVDATGRAWPRTGNRAPHACPHGVFPCQGADRWCAMSVLSDDQWRACVEALGSPPGLAGERFAAMAGRRAHEDELERELAAVTRQWPVAELTAALMAAGVPAGVAADSRDIFQDPQLLSRGFFRPLRHPELGEHWIMQSPPLFARTPQRMRRHAPMLGQDNQTVCQDLLDLKPAEIEALAAAGAFGPSGEPQPATLPATGQGESS